MGLLEGIRPKAAFAVVSFFLGELGDGLNIFQGIYLVALGWNEGAVGIALSMMGITALVVQPFAGDIIDKTTRFDRRSFLSLAAVATALSASAVMFVREGNVDHGLMYATKVAEGIGSSFIAPCLAALTLANFGPEAFDAVMAANIFWGHVGSVAAALLAGLSGYLLYPDIKYCFLVVGASALLAVGGVRLLPEGDPALGRGLRKCGDGDASQAGEDAGNSDSKDEYSSMEHTSVPSSYRAILADRKTVVLCLTGFFFHFANANVLLVLGEIMGGENEDGSATRSALPLVAGAIVLAQLTMAAATYAGDALTKRGVGRKPLFLAGLLTLPLRCALVIYWRDAGDAWLLSTQVLDGIGGGMFGLLHPYLVNDIAFGSGHFNFLMGLTAACFGLGATLSNFLGQLTVEKMGHVVSLTGSLALSVVPIVLFSVGMPETLGQRGKLPQQEAREVESDDAVGGGVTLV